MNNSYVAPGSVRWTFRRKADLLRRLSEGELTRGEAGALYGLSEAEISEWERRDQAGGARALRATERALGHDMRPRRRGRPSGRVPSA